MNKQFYLVPKKLNENAMKINNIFQFLIINNNNNNSKII